MISQQKPIRLIFCAECYANVGFADVLVQRLEYELQERDLSNKIRVETVHIACKEEKVLHTPTSGRDTVLKKVVNLLRMYKQPIIGVIVIDYEAGLMRKYVDALLKYDIQKGVLKFDKIIIRIGITSQEARPLVGIVFDPHIEEALICKIEPNYCKKEYQRKIKTSKGRNIVSNLLNTDQESKELIIKLSKILIDSAIPQALELCKDNY